MDKVAKLPKKARRELFEETASRRGMTPAVVEKDFWVCWVLNRLFSSPLRAKLLFKGGTSLSKVFNLIERFSEDIDLVLDIREIGRDLGMGLEVSRRRRDEAAAEIHQLNTDYLQSTLVPELRELLGDTCEVLDVPPAGGDAGNHPKEIRIRYPAAFSSSYLRPEVLLEVSPLALWLPQGDFEITPYAAVTFPDVFIQPKCPVRAIVAERSFWEKATILHVLAHWPDDKPVPSRYSRHLYDLAQMARAPVCTAAMARLDLLRTVADFKATYYAQATAHYDLARTPRTLKLVPGDRVLAELAQDYRSMREMFYGSPPTFDAVVTALRELEAEINAMPEPQEGPEHARTTMTPLDPHADGASADLIAENIERLKALFPELVTEGSTGTAVNVDVLKSLVGDQTLTDADEKYGLTWHGKRRARQLALTPSTGTLRPCPEESVDWDTTQNLMIEGDNLEVLKLLQKSYAGKVKLIYIDPPYNTGKDFVYPDNFQDNIKNYLELTGQVDGGQKISSNTEASGRFHTDWLNMMYPRLKLARNLLKENGFIFISIDDGEAENLRRLCDDVFGEENFVAKLVWKSRVSEDTRAKTGVSTDHEYIVCYSRGDQVSLRGSEKDVDKFSNPDNDPRGPWRSADLTGLATKESRPNLHYNLIDPKTGIDYGCPPKGWRYEKSTMSQKISEGRILFPSNGDGRPRHKLFLNELRSLYKNMSSVITEFSTADGTRDVNSLLGPGVFSFPKPTGLVASIIDQATEAEDIVLDFFAGSGTSGHATLLRSAVESSSRRFVLVQLPEPLDPATADQKVAADFCDKLGKPRNIAELTKERLRRAAAIIKADNPMFTGSTGFRVFKLDSTNLNVWDPSRQDLPGSLLASVDHIKDDRSEQDLLYELLLKRGLDLCVPIEQKVLAGKTVHSIGAGVLLVCLAERIAREDVEELAQGLVAWHQELATAGESTCIFRDSAFVDDVAKANLTEILKQNGLTQVKSL